jgi:CDP-diacylglycerol--glycerol-3-phosphate 3-phosphatidyltransferase
MVALCLYCLVCGALVSYARARAEGLDLRCDVGIAERAERLLLVLVTTGLDGLGVPYIQAVGLWTLAVLSTVTLGQRLAVVWLQTHHVEAGTRPDPPGSTAGSTAS